MIFQHPVYDYISNVETVQNAGGKVPAEYSGILERWKLYQALEKPNREKLIQGITDHKSKADLGELRALAFAEMTSPVDYASLRKEVEASLYLALQNAYQSVAEANYNKLAEAWTKKAAEFIRCATVIDPSTPAAHLMHADDETRTAWTQGQTLSLELTATMPPVIAAANLAGVQVLDGKRGAPATFGLFAKPTPKGRRNAWEAWNSENRWNELRKLGIKIECASVANHQPYREPLPLQWVPGAVNRQVDPEIEIEANL